MRNQFQIFALALCCFVFFAGSASADCVANSDGSQTVTGSATSICRVDAKRLVFAVVGLGFCSEFPDLTVNSNALSSCTNIIASSVDVDLQIGTTQSVPMTTPKPGTYGYTYRLTKAVAKFSAVFEFTNDMIGGTGADLHFNPGDPATYTVGKYCQPPSFKYDLTTVFGGILPSRCTSTPPISTTLAEFNFNNIGLNTWQPIASIFANDPANTVYAVNPAADQNVFLLDADMKVATSKEAVQYGLLVTRNATPIVVSDSVLAVNVKFGLTGSISATVGCPGGYGNCLVYTPWINGRVIDVTVTNAPSSASYE